MTCWASGGLVEDAVLGLWGPLLILTTGPLGAMVPGLGGACVAASWGAVFQGVGTPGLWGPWIGVLDLCPAGLCLGTLSGKGLGLMGVDADAELDP